MRLPSLVCALAALASHALAEEPAAATANPATPALIRPGSRPLTIAADLAVGYDSNAIFQPDVNPDTTDTQGAAIVANGSATLRLIDRDGRGLASDQGRGRRLAAGLGVGIQEYPGHPEAEMGRVSATMMGHQHVGAVDPGFVLGYHHYWLDRENAADVINLEAFASRIRDSFQHIDILVAGAEFLSYPQDEDKSGVLGSLSYRYWYLPERKNIRRRLELGLSASLMRANADYASYTGVSPSIAGLWRFGSGERLGTTDLSAKLDYEFRRYAGGGPQQSIVGATAGWDAWICANATIGIYAAWTRRISEQTSEQYSRYQAGARLGVTW
ncbi:MAG: hypothetical protein H0V44_03740 [Planctomycetes bacterium]|nr:hypothetical protein [Planctomycetota bacterium]